MMDLHESFRKYLRLGISVVLSVNFAFVNKCFRLSVTLDDLLIVHISIPTILSSKTLDSSQTYMYYNLTKLFSEQLTEM